MKSQSEKSVSPFDEYDKKQEELYESRIDEKYMDKDKPKIGDPDLGGEGLEYGDVKAAFCDALDLEKDSKGKKIETKEKKQKEKDEILPFEWFHIRQETKKEIKRI